MPVSDSAFQLEVSHHRYCIRSSEVVACTVCFVNQYAKLDFRYNSFSRYFIRRLLARLQIGLRLPNL